MYSTALSSVQIGVADLREGERAYTTLFGFGPHDVSDGPRYSLGNGAIQLVSGGDGIRSLRFACKRDLPSPVGAGVPVEFVTDEKRMPALERQGLIEAIDHVVIQTGNIERAKAYWSGQVNLRLALDRVFPERGLRILFYRTGGTTLELVGLIPELAERSTMDRFHGIAYRTMDLAAERERLVRAGLDVSEIRRGFKPGTSVATVRSGMLGVPTLLLQDPSRI